MYGNPETTLNNQRLMTSYGTHHWTPPKGHVDPGEDKLTTAIRETNEEAGLTRNQYQIIDGFQKTLRYAVNGRMKCVNYWLAELKQPRDQVQLSDEHQDYKWLVLSDALKLAEYPEMIEALNDANAFILKSTSYG
ncbi:bis(5'-nucleosyl)-tetraphosphatase [asymmetrical]-like isoform X2 [Tubulanus polymorphus]|uniref:bis(5'-nucleosyl)-tetraphosphatase [asymmetrical]-like isoform X2 n=1 Tax=Tubulanus polymorphus TaxID=672921 RepID=UPI003DA5E7B3